MKQNLFAKQILKVTSWTTAHLSWMTMALSPVALGKEAESKNTEYYKQYIHELGLDQKMTVKDFWLKVKNDLPGYVYFEIEQLYKTNPNALMPQFEVKSSKGSDGEVIPVLSFSENGKNHTVQIFADKQKYLKFDNVVMNESEAKNPAQLFQKLIDADSKLNLKYKQDVKKLRQPSSSDSSSSGKSPRYDFSTFKGFDRMTPQMWQLMDKQARASYIIQMRQMWMEARKANFYTSQKESLAPKNKNEKSKKTSSLEKMFQLLLIEEAHAQAATTGQKAQKIIAAKTEVKDPNANSCVVAGWVSSYGKGNGSNYNKTKTSACSLAELKKNPKYVSNSIANKALTSCIGQNQMACNPMVFGYRPNGATICVSTTTGNQNYNTAVKDNFQKATWWGGPCDSVNQLTKSVDQFKLNDKPGQKYKDQEKRINSDGSVNQAVADEQIGLIEKDQEKDQYQMTQNFINSILAAKDTTLAKVLEGEWTKESDDLLVDIQIGFQTEINEAIHSCEVSVGIPKQADQLQKGACDQLHRRWIFTERFISQYRNKACLAPSSYNWDFTTNKTSSSKKELTDLNKLKSSSFKVENNNLPCSCEVGGKKLFFNFKESAEACKNVEPAVVDPVKCPTGSDSDVVNADGQCSCTPVNDPENKKFFDPKEGLPKTCSSEPGPVDPKVACDQTPPLSIAGGQLNEDCTCKGTGNKPKEDQPGFFAKLFNTKTNRQFAKPSTEDGTRKRNKASNNDQKREYSCKFGPNWWAVAGLGVGIAGLTALLLMKRKTKVITNTVEVPKQVIKEVPVDKPVCNSPPKSYWTGSSCECPPCGKYYMADGTQNIILPNPLTCACTPPPSEGGEGSNDGGSGGVPTDTNK